MWCVKPETLLDYQDFCQWLHYQAIKCGPNGSINPQSCEEFEKVSQQAWTYLLMQTIKVLQSKIVIIFWS